MVRIVNRARIEELKVLWLKCFDDSEEYVDFFFNNIFDEAVAIAGIHNGKVTGAAYLFPCDIWDGCLDILIEKAYYLYAAGVLPQYRGKGIFTEICNYISEYCRIKDRKLFLYALPELRKMYSEKGMKNFYYSREVNFNGTGDVNKTIINLQELDAEEYASIRNTAFSYGKYIHWSDRYLQFAVNEKKFCHGICNKFDFDGRTHTIIGDIKGCMLNIEETSMNYSELQKLSCPLCKAYGVSDISFRIPCSSASKEQTLVFSGMGDIELTDLWISLILL